MKIYLFLFYLSSGVFNLVAAGPQGGWIIGWGYNGGGEVTGRSPYNYTTNKAEMMAQILSTNISIYATGTVAVAGQVLSNITTITGGLDFPLALNTTKQVINWGMSNWETNRDDRSDLPTNLDDVVAISAAHKHYLAVKSEGSVVEWGRGGNGDGLADIPDGLSNVVAVAAMDGDSLALRRDGTLMGWGRSINIPEGVSNIVAISASPEYRLGINHPGDCLSLTQNGTVIELRWSSGPMPAKAKVIDGLKDIIAISAGAVHNLAIKRDRSIVAWGFNGNGELNAPRNLTNVVAIAASGTGFPAAGFSLALNSSGQVIAWGRMNGLPVTVPEGLSNIVAIAAGRNYCLAITTNAAVAERFRQK